MERARAFVEQRREIARTRPLSSDLIAHAVRNAAKQVETLQIERFTSDPQGVIFQLSRFKAHLKEWGYPNEPSNLRLSAEFATSIAREWMEIAQTFLGNGDVYSYTFFADIGTGAGVVSAAILEGDTVNVTGARHFEETGGAEMADLISEDANEGGITAAAGVYLDAVRLSQIYTDLLKEDPTGKSAMNLALAKASTPKETDPLQHPHIIEFTKVGAKLAIKMIETLNRIQEEASRS